MWSRNAILCACFALMCTACTQEPVIPAKLEAPARRLMLPPPQLAAVKTGDDLVKTAAVCRAEYGRETGKLSGLQNYVKTILKK